MVCNVCVHFSTEPDAFYTDEARHALAAFSSDLPVAAVPNHIPSLLEALHQPLPVTLTSPPSLSLYVQRTRALYLAPPLAAAIDASQASRTEPHTILRAFFSGCMLAAQLLLMSAEERRARSGGDGKPVRIACTLCLCCLPSSHAH